MTVLIEAADKVRVALEEQRIELVKSLYTSAFNGIVSGKEMDEAVGEFESSMTRLGELHVAILGRLFGAV